MRKWIVVLVSVMLLMGQTAFAADELMMLDFDTGDKPNNLGGDFGAWDKDPNDDTQTAVIGFNFGDDPSGNADGYSLQVDYDVDSPNPAYNGFWTKLEGEDFSNYDTLNLYIKGDETAGFTKRIKLELKDFQSSSPFILNGITSDWQKFQIPFEKFTRIKDWSSMNELVIVFDDVNSSPKVGTIFIDQISVSKEL
ncbi:carbohydrate binding domain-containing protein [Candidatus Omnitrophota bacterium]